MDKIKKNTIIFLPVFVAFVLIGAGSLVVDKKSKNISDFNYIDKGANLHNDPKINNSWFGGADGNKKNIILITIDTLRADHLGFMGYPRDTSPFLDKLASESVVFKNAFTVNPLTTPAHASIFTGIYPEENNVIKNLEKLDDRFTTLAEYLQENEYNTAAFVSSINVINCNLEQGFDFFNKNSDDNDWDFENMTGYKKMFVAKEYRSAYKVVDRAIRWMDDQAGDDSFFIWIHFNDAHKKVMSAGQSYEDVNTDSNSSNNEIIDFLKNEQKINLPLLEKDYNYIFRKFDRSGNLVPPDLLNNTDMYGLKVINRYDGAIQAIDRQIGVLYGYLEEKFTKKSNLWIITSDHGIGLGSHNYYDHLDNIYNEQLLAPIIIHSTGNKKHKTVDSIVESIDILPTIAGIVGFSLSDEIDGESLLPLTLNDNIVDGLAYSIHPLPNIVSLQSNKYKYILHKKASESGLDELYDIESDPLELTNLIDMDELSEVREMLKNKILKNIMSAEFAR